MKRMQGMDQKGSHQMAWTEAEWAAYRAWMGARIKELRRYSRWNKKRRWRAAQSEWLEMQKRECAASRAGQEVTRRAAVHQLLAGSAGKG